MNYELWWLAAAVLARLCYVGYIWAALRRQFSYRSLTFEDFKKRAKWVMNLDTLVFIWAVFELRGELAGDYDLFLRLLGLVLIIVGLAVKGAAAKALGDKGYYWHDFFLPEGEGRMPRKTGIYKYLKSPMYGLGYLHAYGWALLWLSVSGLFLAAFMQAMIILFWYFVERPNFERVYLANRVEKTSNGK